MVERRRFRRYQTTMFAKCLKTTGYVRISSLAAIKNIGLGGLCAILSKMIRRGDKLLLELYLPNDKKLATLAEVIWTKPSEDTGGNICGLKFISISSPSLLKDYIVYASETSVPS